MGYDADSHRVVLFGGFDSGGRDGETWTYDLASNTWTNMNPTTSPSARAYQSMAYDPDSHRVVLFGGIDSEPNNETWTYDVIGNTWTNMDPTTSPSARYWHSMVYNPDSHRVVLFGGRDYDGLYNETWTYDLARNTWINMNPSTVPSARYWPSMVYDPDSHRVVLFGGNDGGYDDETWVYPANRYCQQGRFDSQLIDVENICTITGEISWTPSGQPSETVLEVQIGFSNTTHDVDFIYDLSHTSDFTFDGRARYLRYRAVFQSDANQVFTSNLETVSIYYTLGIPDYIEVFLAYLDGNATLIQHLIDWSGGNATLLNNLFDSMAGNATLLQEVIGWLDGNHSAIEALFTYVEGNATLLLQTISVLDSNTTQIQLVAALATANYEWLQGLNSTAIGNITEIRDVLAQLGVTVGDLDYDGLDDLDEIFYGTDIQCIDTDCDNLNDAFEIKIGTNPLDDDSDADTYFDGIEVMYGTDPLDSNDYPGMETSTTTPTSAPISTTTPPPDESSILALILIVGIGAVAVAIVLILVFMKKRR